MINLDDIRFGWRPELYDHRDWKYSATIPDDTELPQVVDLRPGMPPVYNQGKLGSCTAQAICAAVQYVDFKHFDIEAPCPSRLFVYYFEREMIGTIHEDSGAQIRDGFKVINEYGVCREETWPYDINRFATHPIEKATKEALDHQSLEYRSISMFSVPLQMKRCLADGHPFVFGATICESFTRPKNGFVPMPARKERPLGGHAMLCVGYDDTHKIYIVRNSWGEGWGSKGYCYVPYDFMEGGMFCDDAWAVTKME